MRALSDLPGLLTALRCEPLWDVLPLPPDARPRAQPATVVVGCRGDFPWFGLVSERPEPAARSLARRMAGRGQIGGVLALDPASRRLALAVAFDQVTSLCLDLACPSTTVLGCLTRLAGDAGGGGAVAYAAAAADALAGESVGRRFFQQFRATLEQMIARLPGPWSGEDRRSLALLQLTRVLFLYFVQAKGWLAGRERFLSEAVDHCLARKRRIHRDLLRPLFFGTLNRPASERSRTALEFGAIPFLNGGLFEPHPLERRLRCDIPNAVWRDAFDGLFERFHFAVAEGQAGGRIAPDMLGRVFEGVMAPDARRASGTYYTPAALVQAVLDAAIVAAVAGRVGCGESEAEARIAEGNAEALGALHGLTILDPAVGSGAFLLGALERLSAAGPALAGEISERRRRVLQRNLFGVDRSAAAVRLTELRLWLAVIADDPSERPEEVRPLPNLDCLVRQGDSLFEPIGCGFPLPAPRSGTAMELATLRQRFVSASGRSKTALLRDLTLAELRATDESLGGAESGLRTSIEECLREARGHDLFGERRGLDRQLRERLDGLRRQLREIRRARRTLARDREVPWFHYQSHFADVFARGGFDLVVGNPPWLRAEELAPELRRRLAGRYRWWRTTGPGYAHRPDLAVAFLERAFELVVPDGVVALLLPAKLATAGYGAIARHELAAGTTLLSVADLTGHPEAAFDATVYPMAIVARRSVPPAKHRVRTALRLGAGYRALQSRLRGGGPWVLGPDRIQCVLASLGQEHPRLDERITCHLGLKTGSNQVFLDPPEDLEPEVLRWALRGRDLRPFRAEARLRLLWTHGEGGAPRRLLPPRATAYLAPYLSRLRRRADFDGGPPWTVFRTGPATAAHRVVWADLARRLTAVALTGPGDQDRIPLNSCYVAALEGAEQADRVAAWLNSTWVRAMARVGAVPAASGFARFTAATVGALPLPRSALADPNLAAMAQAGRRGDPIQNALDALVARHLRLSPAARCALRGVGDRTVNSC